MYKFGDKWSYAKLCPLCFSMNRFKAWLGEGLILVPTVLLVGFLLFTFSFHASRLTNLAELLPPETQAFLIVNMRDYWASGGSLEEEAFKTFVGTPYEQITWFDEEMAIAWVDGNRVQLVEMKVKSEAEAYYQALVEGEALVPSESNPKVQCYLAQSLCFREVGKFLAVSNFEEPLLLLEPAGPSLEDQAAYQNVRTRLGHLSSAFAYVNLEETGEDFLKWLSPEDFSPPLFLKSVFTLFPSWGVSVNMEPSGWYMESFTAANKDALHGAYFHPTENYEQNFLPWTKAFAWEWGSQDLSAQLLRLQEIFADMGSSGELIFNSSVENTFSKLFGQVDLQEVLILLDGESYFGWTSSDDFLCILALDEGDLQLAQELKTAFVETYKFKDIYTGEQGETKAELTALTEFAKDYEGTHYQVIKAGDEVVAAIAFTQKAAIVAASEEQLLAVLDRKDGRQSGRNLEEMEVLLPGSNEIWILDSAFLPEGHILKTRLSTLTRLMSTRKIFDDGVFTRTSLLR